MFLNNCIQEFLEDKQFQNLSSVSVENYELTLNEFSSYLGNPEIEEITCKQIKDYLHYCKEARKNNPTSINGKLRNLKLFFNYCKKEELIQKNPAEKIPFLKEEHEIEIFTNLQLEQIFNSFKKKYRNFYQTRNYMICFVLLGTGIRLGELVSLKWENINFNENTLKVNGKTGIRYIPLTEKLKNELLNYQEYLGKQFNELKYVFIDKQNKPLTKDSIKCIFKNLKKKLNFTNLHAHTFRHTFCTISIINGCNLFDLQRMTGHTSIEMLNRYYHIAVNDLVQKAENSNPLNLLAGDSID